MKLPRLTRDGNLIMNSAHSNDGPLSARREWKPSSSAVATTVLLLPIERVLIGLFFIVIIAFGALTLVRSAYLAHRHTDAGVYFRAAWAARVGGDIYEAT